MEQKKYTNEEYSKMYMFEATRDNLEAMTEIKEHQRFFGENVKVIKGRKVPIGTKGVVVWLKRLNYGNSKFGWATRIGIKDENNVMYYTNVDNVELIKKEGEEK